MKTLRFYGTLLMAVLFASLVACSESSDSEEQEKPVKPDTPVSGNTAVDEKGGSFTVDGLTLKIPSGAYTEKKALTVSKAKKGSVVSGDEISDCYQLKFDGSTHKPIKIGIKADKGTDVRLAVLSEGYAQSDGRLLPIESVSLLKTTYSNGTYIAQLPAIAMDEAIATVGDAAANESTEIKMTVALVDVGNDTSGSRQTAETRASRGYAYFDLIWLPNSKKDFDQDALLRENIIPEVLKKLENLGFKLPEGEIVPIIMREFTGVDATKWGMYEMSKSTKSLDKVSVNTKYFQGTLSETDLQQLKATMIHELQHYFQGIGYDDTTAPMRFLYNWFGSSQWQLIDEASSVWSEKFYVKASVANKANDLTVGHGADATTNLIPGVAFTSYHKSEHTDELGLAVEKGTAFYRCGDRGYGLSLFIYYLAQMYGDNTPVHLFEARKNGSKTVEECFKSYGTQVGDDVLSTATLHDFMSEACRGKVYLSSLVNFEYFFNDQSSIKSLWSNSLITDKPTVSKSFKLPKYGTLVHKYMLGGGYMEKNGLESFDGKHVEVTQESEDVSTEVWLVTGEDWGGAKLLGTTTGGKKVEYKDVEMLLGKSGKSKATIYTISVPLRKDVVSGTLKCEVKDGGMISVDENYLVFGADEETQQVKATSDQPKFTARTNADWLKVKTAKGGIVEITAIKNSSSAAREDSVSVIALDANGKEMAKTTVVCHQLGREGGDDKDDFYLYAKLSIYLDCTINALSVKGDYIKTGYSLSWGGAVSNSTDGLESSKDDKGMHFSRTEKYTIDDTDYENTLSFSVSGLESHSTGGASISNVRSVYKEKSSTKDVIYELEISGGFEFDGYTDIINCSGYEIKGENIKPSVLKFKETVNGKVTKEFYKLNPKDGNFIQMAIIYRKNQ